MTVVRPAPVSRKGGFTLIELLVAVGLATILITTVVLIFYGSTDIFKTSEARMTVYGNARAALDIFARDLQSCLPLESGQQNFVMQNAGGVGYTPGATPGDDPSMATDSIRFRAIIPVNPPGLPTTLRSVECLYSLVNDTDPELLTAAGLPATQRTNRTIRVLRKQVFDFAAGGAEMMNERADLCHYVLSMNLEYFANTGTQVRPFPPHRGPCWGGSPAGPAGTPAPLAAGTTTPIANALGLPAASGGSRPLPSDYPRLPLGVRITLRVVEGAGERQERMIARTVWIPLS